jgi:hypothetical protein
MAERGCVITAVELGGELAAVARRNLARFPSVDVVVSAFEIWPLPGQPYDAVVSATAFHWLDPEIRVGRAAGALRPGGALATIATHHVAGGTEAFFAEVQECYLRWDPQTEPGDRLPAAADIELDSGEIDASGRFAPAVFRRYEWELSYTSAAYSDLLRTYSGHQAMEPAALQGLLDCVTELIDSRFGGQIAKRYLTELRVAIRR